MTPAEERRKEDSERGRIGSAGARAALERALDPDGTLSPEELAQRLTEHYREKGRRGGKAARRIKMGEAVNPERKGLERCPAAHQAQMCHGHHMAGPTASVPAEPRPPGQPDVPDLLLRPDVLALLADRDIGGLYRALNDAGVSQRQIAERTGQAQSEVSEILHGRQVRDVTLLERIADGLEIPRGLLRLAGVAEPDAYSGDVTLTAAPDEVDDDMLRRHLLAYGGVVLAGAPVEGLGELLEGSPTPGPVPLPDRLTYTHVAQVRDLAHQLREGLRTHGSRPEISSAAVQAAGRLLDASGPEPVRQALMTALAELHLHAGWAGFDAGLYRRAMWHYAQALELALESGDAYCQALALNRAGLATLEHGYPNDALKMLQAGQVKAWDIPLDLGRSVVIGEGSRVAVEARSRADSATALTAMGATGAAEREQGVARELWTPARTDPAGDLDYVAACLALQQGRLDVAELFAASSVRRWEGVSQRARTQSGVVLATVHVQARESRGLALAKSAIDAVAPLHSVRTRQRLLPLAQALECHSSEGRELARMAWQVAA